MTSESRQIDSPGRGGYSAVIAIVMGLACGSALGHDEPPGPGSTPPAAGSAAATHGSLAAQATSPVSNLIQFRLQNQYGASTYNASGYSNAAMVQAVVPLMLPFEKVPMVITRTTAPYVSTPQLDGVGRKHGLGDTVFLSLFVPKLGLKGATLGFGPTVTIPTAGDNDYTGAGQWQAGPTAVYLNHATPTIQWGLLAFQQWDFASTRSNAEDVSQLFLQPIFTKHLSGGWYVSTPDDPQVYDFETEEWTLNLGAVVGRVFSIGKQPVQIFGGVYYNSEDNDEIVSGEWTIKFSFGFLFPE
jgi:hypothetical protein